MACFKKKQISKFHVKSPDFRMLTNNSKFSKYFAGQIEHMCRMTQPPAQEFVTASGKQELKKENIKRAREKAQRQQR